MAIPKYFELYLPILKCLEDGEQKRTREIVEHVASVFRVTKEEREVLLPSRKQAVFDNRVGWAKTYLKKAGLIESPARGIIVITTEGKKVLNENPGYIDEKILLRYDSFRSFLQPTGIQDTHMVATSAKSETPQEEMDRAFKVINERLADELMTEIMKQTPAAFEAMVVKLLERMGYGGVLENPGNVVGRSGDEGIDGIIREDKLGFNMIHIQAKRWDVRNTIGRPEIQRFVGALVGQGATKGLFITTTKFSKDAEDYAKKHLNTKIILIDGQALAKLMIEHDLGVSIEEKYEIKRIDTDFFSLDVD